MNKKKIFVLNDDPKIVNLIKILVEASGIEVVTADNWSHAVKELIEIEPDLLILDIELEGISGIRFYDTFKTYFYESIPIIIYSAKEKPANLKLGAKDKYCHNKEGIDALVEIVKSAVVA